MKEIANCIRQVENWSVIKDYHKMDSPQFDPVKVKAELATVSPKMKQLLENIRALDSLDMQSYGTKFKHMIFSDLKSVGGAKSIGSALLSNNYKLIFNDSLEIIDTGKSDYKFAIMCSTKIYNKDVGVRFKRKVFDIFNKRPDNVYGKNCRFMILDYGFKEGVDLFDIKYVHIMESPITHADKQQIIGRGTRLCGQKMLDFDSVAGWRLNVFIYNSIIPSEKEKETETLFSLFLKYSNIDLTKDIFRKELEKTCIQSSVDFQLNKNIHIYKKPAESEFVLLAAEVKQINSNIPISKSSKEIKVVYGQKLEKHGDIDCRKGCRESVQLIPTELLLLAWYVRKSNIYANEYINYEKPRPMLCIYLIEDIDFCNQVKEMWKHTEEYIIKHEMMLRKRIHALDANTKIIKNQVDIMEKFINSITITNIDLREAPSKIMTYEEHYHFMNKNYSNLKWPPIIMENQCIEKPNNDNNNTLEFSPSQKFLQSYFTPESAYKGILVWHSTGTGKTCTGISMATNTFEKKGYTILWVTRNSLRSDMWKNMFKQVCSISIREKNEAFDVEDALKHPKRYISKNWLAPITYRQLSNLMLGKNTLYQEMIKRNGVEDPLKNTLIIIDEAHKLLSADLIAQEKPDFDAVHNKIQESYIKSGKNSAKLLLMSATPYTDDPMHLIKLFNLMRPPSSQFPTDFTIFSEKFLTKEGLFKKPIDFMSEITGYISYLNRSGDVRQFAQPIITKINVPISTSKKDGLDHLTELYNDSKKKIEITNAKLEVITENEKQVKEAHKIELAKLKKKKDKDEFTLKFKTEQKNLKEIQVKPLNIIISNEKEKMKVLQKQIKSVKDEIIEKDFSQERILKHKCLTGV